MNDNTICAYVDWVERWRTETDPTDWVVPDEEVIERARAVHAAGARRALDHGCGIGRHDLAIANVGFEVDAFDVSQTGLAKIAAQTERHELPINTHRRYMNAQLFEEARNDFIVSWSFFYHGGDAILRRAMARIYRVLKTNGTVLLTKLSKRNVGFGVGRRDSTNFWVDQTRNSIRRTRTAITMPARRSIFSTRSASARSSISNNAANPATAIASS